MPRPSPGERDEVAVRQQPGRNGGREELGGIEEKKKWEQMNWGGGGGRREDRKEDGAWLVATIVCKPGGPNAKAGPDHASHGFVWGSSRPVSLAVTVRLC